MGVCSPVRSQLEFPCVRDDEAFESRSICPPPGLEPWLGRLPRPLLGGRPLICREPERGFGRGRRFTRSAKSPLLGQLRRLQQHRLFFFRRDVPGTATDWMPRAHQSPAAGCGASARSCLRVLAPRRARGLDVRATNIMWLAFRPARVSLRLRAGDGCVCSCSGINCIGKSKCLPFNCDNSTSRLPCCAVTGLCKLAGNDNFAPVGEMCAPARRCAVLRRCSQPSLPPPARAPARESRLAAQPSDAPRPPTPCSPPLSPPSGASGTATPSTSSTARRPRRSSAPPRCPAAASRRSTRCRATGAPAAATAPGASPGRSATTGTA